MDITSVVVRHFQHLHLTFLYGVADTTHRMLMFFVALFLYCFSLSNLRSRISIASISLVVLAFFVGCMWTIWESSNKWAVWLDGLPSPISHALVPLHLSCLPDAAMSFPKCFRSRTTNDTGSEHEMATPRG